MINPELRRQIQRIIAVNKKINGGAVNSTQAGNNVLCLMVAEELIIIAMVPGPAVLGMASGMKAKLACSFGLLTAAEAWTGGGKSIFKPMIMRIPPPAIRNPGMEMLKASITNSPM
ncbi:hypothetical protein D3C86_1837870 [compost metagenome]